MRVELIPILVGLLVVLVGASMIWDARTASDDSPLSARRRRRRAAIDLQGEWISGAGIALLGGALLDRDGRFETVLVLIGALLLLYGAIRNRHYFREVFLFRGAARRGAPSSPRPEKLRIR